MAANGYDLGVQIQIQAPTNANVASVVKQVQRQFSSANVPVNIQVNAKALAQANSQISNVGKGLKNASKNAAIFGDSLGAAARRFGGFAIGTQILGKISSSFSKATKDAIEFEKTLNQIRQITGQTTAQLSSLTKTITQLSTSLGASSNDLVNVTKILNQAGFAASDVRKSLEILAQTTLGSSFGNIADTAEGAIAILRQFDRQAQQVGDTSKFLAQSLDAVNAVSKRFAVEASDIIAAVRRVGGVFSAAGGEVNELIALFTSIRATTRESAETIAVGLRTIFSRLQRTDTIDALQSLGVTLQDVNGQFVGPLKAIEALSQALSSIDPRDYRISAIVEELGGIRQVGKVIPLIYQYATAQEALRVANASGGSVAADAALAQETLATQFAKTGQAFAALTRKFTESQGFKEFAKTLLDIANSLIKVADSILPLLPLINKLAAGFLAVKGIGALGKAVGIGKNSGGKIQKFARGGFVPGSGNRDTVPAMLTPGEFVIKKSSVQKLGASTLEAMNQNRFNDGKDTRSKDVITPGQAFERQIRSLDASAVLSEAGDKTPGDKEIDIGGAFLKPDGALVDYDSKIKPKNKKAIIDAVRSGLATKITDKQVKEALGNSLESISIGIQSGSFSAKESDLFQSELATSIAEFATGYAGQIGMKFSSTKFSQAYKKANLSQTEGNVFEALLNGLSDAPFDDTKIADNDTFDFRNGLGDLGDKFGIAGSIPTDAKRTFGKDSLGSLTNKGVNLLIAGYRSELAQQLQASNAGGTDANKKARTRAAQVPGRRSTRSDTGSASTFAVGGQVDNVPALLTPGEYVINKAAAQRIGYDNLNSMNKTGVARFATGGPVGVQRLNSGGDIQLANAAPGFIDLSVLEKSAKDAAKATQDNTKADKDNTKSLNDMGDAVESTTKKQKSASDRISDMGGRIQQVGLALTFGASIVLQYSKDMLGLSDAQAKAAQEAIGFAGVLATGIGSTAQLAVETLTMIATFKANAAAIDANTSSQISAAAAAGGGSSKLAEKAAVAAGGLAVLTAVVSLVGAAARYQASLARQKADETAEAFDTFIEKLKSGEGDISNAGQLARERAQAAAASRGAASSVMPSIITGVLAATAVGLTAFFAPFIAAGATVSLVVAGIAGLGAGFASISYWTDKYTEEIDSTSQQLTRLAEATAEAADVQFRLADGLKNIDEEANAALSGPGVTEEQRQRVQARAAERRTALIAEQGGRIDTTATDEALKALQVASEKTGISLAGLTEENIKGSKELSVAQQQLAIQAIKTRDEQKKASDDAVKASKRNLNDIASREIDGSKTFEELIAANGAFARSLRDTETLIRKDSELREKNLVAERAEALARARKADDEGRVEDAQAARSQAESLGQKIEQEVQSRDDSIDALKRGYQTSVDLAIENRKRAEQEARVRAAMARTVQQFEALNAALTATNVALTRIDEYTTGFASAVSGEVFSAQRAVPENLGDITNIGDRAQFENELATALSPFGQQGQRLFDQITSGADLLETANDRLGSVEFDIGSGDTVNVEDIFRGTNINRQNLGNDIFNQIQSQIKDFAQKQGGTLSGDQIAEIFEPALQEAKIAGERARQLAEISQRQLGLYEKNLDKLSAQFDREIVARQKLVDIELQNAEILAKAGVRGEVTAQEREQARTRRAQIGLAGTGVVAGDVDSAERVLRQATDNLVFLNEKVNSRTATPADLKAIRANARAAAGATKELERLADQSGKVADIQSDIEKEQRKRAAVAGIAEDFVFGGNQTREQINKGLAGVQAALATGTVQNQSEEQRAATLATLDKLQDIPFFKQLKKNLVASDIFRITGNADLANAIQNATPEEERLQKELIAVTQQRTQASMVLAQMEFERTQALINKENELINALNQLTTQLSRLAPPQQGQQQGRVGANTGGKISGSGTSTSDSIPAQLSDGEYVINTKAARQLGYNNLDLMNQGKMPAFAAGGGIIGAAAREVFQVSNTGTITGLAGANVGQDGIVNTGLDATIGAGQSIAAGGGAAGAATAAAAAYGIHTAVSAGQTAVGLATDYFAGTDKTAQAARDQSAKQARQSTTQNIGENLTNPGQAGLQLAQESVGLANDRQTAADAQAKTARLERDTRIRQGIRNRDNNPLLTRGARGVNGAYIPEGFANGGGSSGDIPAMLSDGEYVINAKAAKELGYQNLDLMNQGKKPRYAGRGGRAKLPRDNRSNNSGVPTVTTTGSSGLPRQEGIGGGAVGRGGGAKLPRDNKPSGPRTGQGFLGAGEQTLNTSTAVGRGGGAKLPNKGYASSPSTETTSTDTTATVKPPTKPYRSGIPQTNVSVGYPMANQQFPQGGSGPKPQESPYRSGGIDPRDPTQTYDPFLEASDIVSTIPTTSNAAQYAPRQQQQTARPKKEPKPPTLYQQQQQQKRDAYQNEMARRRNAYQDEMARRREMYNGNTEQGRINLGRRGQMAAMQLQNRYNARAANFNNSIAQSQMAFRQQAARFVGAGALQGAGGRMLGGGGFGGGGFSGRISQRQTNNMISAANNGGGMQQMNGMTINHNVTVSGMIAIGGLNIQGISAAISQSVGQMVAAEVSKQLKGMNSGFRTGT